LNEVKGSVLTASAPRPSLRAVPILALATVLAVLLAAPAHAARVGAVADVTWGQPKAAVDRELGLLQAAGVEWIRANVNWAGLERNANGQIDSSQLAEYEYAVDRAHALGLKVLMPISDGVPYWASADPAKYVDSNGERHWNKKWKPANMADYGGIVRYVVQHFRDRGVETYEIWNEPNHKSFWPSGPDPADYVPMLREGYQAVKGVDPNATVLLGGLSKNDFAYLEGVYRAGGGEYFDAVAVHPYTHGVAPTSRWNGVNADEDPNRLSKNSFPAIEEIKRSMDAFGDAGKQIWITEFGYSTTSQSGGVSAEEQAQYLADAYRYVEALPYVRSLFWYSARNTPWKADADDYGSQFGLMTTTFELKPSYDALRAYAALSAPQASITSGPNGATNSPSPRFEFSSPEAATFQCKLDSGDWETCSSPKSYADLPDGAHAFSVRAIDEAGKVDPSPASLTFTVDTKAPVTSSAPDPSFRIGSQLGTSAIPVRLRWGAADAFTPASRLKFDLDQHVDSRTSWSRLLSGYGSPSATGSLTPNRSYKYRALAWDAAHNSGLWATGPTFRPLAYQESFSRVTYAGTWRRIARTTAYGGHVRSASSGARASFTFTGGNTGVVMPMRSTLGTVKICLDPGTARRNCSNIDLSPSRGLGPRRVGFARNDLRTDITHRVRLTVLSGRAELDAFVVMR
jgi:hypothetical protein